MLTASTRREGRRGTVPLRGLSPCHLLNPETAAFLSARRLHPTQRFEQRRDATTLLTMTALGTTELVPWILSLGRYVKVLRPPSLRDEVRSSLQTAVRLYQAAGRG